MFTNIPWSKDGDYHSLDGSSFCFKFDENNDFVKYPSKPGESEVYHHMNAVFAMVGGPRAIDNGHGKICWAKISDVNFKLSYDQDCGTELCGEAEPEIDEIEIYHLEGYEPKYEDYYDFNSD